MMKKEVLTVLLTLCFMMIFSVDVFAEEPLLSPEEQAMIEATAMQVNKAENSITFISPEDTNDVNINVYEKFNDVPEDTWYQSFLSHLVQLGVVRGVNETTFAPDAYVTRAQFVTMLAYAAEADLFLYTGVSSFADVAPGVWYAPQAEWAYQEGLIRGRSGNLFCPDSYVTREEAAVLTHRYAEATESDVLKQNQYELSDESRQELTPLELEELETALATPEYTDGEDISSWAEEEVAAMTDAGILNGDENWAFHPQQPLRRSECVKIISTYIFYDTKPTLIFPGGSSISYIEIEDEEDMTLTEEDLAELGFDLENLEEELADLHGPNFYSDVPITTPLLSEGATLSWATVGHQTLTDRAFQLLRQDTGEGGRAYIVNKMQELVGYNNFYRTGQFWVHFYSWYADEIEEEIGRKFLIEHELNPIDSYEAHFYDPDTGKSWMGSTTRTAYKFFNNHYYLAVTNAHIHDDYHRYVAYKELGLAIHYLEDLNNPYHASNAIAVKTNHREYEAWADENVVPYCTAAMTYQSYRYVYDSSFIGMANNFAGLAKSTYYQCMYYDANAESNAIARAKTQTNLIRTQRAVCGLLNRFYYNGGLNNR